MRILFVSPFDFGAAGGVNEHIIQLDRQFQSLGHQTRILAATSNDYGEDDDGHVYRVGQAVPIPSNGSTARVTLSPLVINKVRQFLEAEEFDVIHLHEPLAPVLPLAVLLFSRSANVGTFHAARSTNLFYLYTKAILDMFFDKLDARVAVSEAAREFADSHFPGDYSIVPNGINLEEFRSSVKPLPNLMDGRKNILFVGRFEESRKGFRYLLRAFPMVREQFPDARLIVVGSGNHDRYERFMRQHGIEDVMFTGFTDAITKARYYASADVFCAPSTGRESFGIILVEAMASGVPVVAAGIPGYQGVIKNGETGILVEPKDEHSLALGLVRILSDTALRETIITNALEDVRQYSWDSVANRLLTVYQSALARHAETDRRQIETIPADLVASDG
jgi:phosphatidyl-myo-inositol alpha-mannosyltransferase